MTAALRKGEKPLLEKTAHASLNLRSFISKGNQRQTHRQHWIKVFQREETACCKVKTAFTSLLKFTLHEMLNWKIIKDKQKTFQALSNVKQSCPSRIISSLMRQE